MLCLVVGFRLYTALLCHPAGRTQAGSWAAQGPSTHLQKVPLRDKSCLFPLSSFLPFSLRRQLFVCLFLLSLSPPLSRSLSSCIPFISTNSHLTLCLCGVFVSRPCPHPPGSHLCRIHNTGKWDKTPSLKKTSTTESLASVRTP